LKVALNGSDITIQEVSGECGTGLNFSCDLGLIPVAESKTVSIKAVPTEVGKVELFAQVTNSASKPTTAIVTTVKSREADLGVSLIANPPTELVPTPETILVESNLMLTLTVTNQGPHLAKNINLINVLPEGVRLHSPISAAGGVVCEEIDAKRQMNCTIESLPNGETLTLNFIVVPTVAGELVFFTQLSSSAIDAEKSNNSHTIKVQVKKPSTLYFVETHQNEINDVQGLEKAFALTISPDGQFIYVVGFSNNAVALFRRNSSDGKLQFVSTPFHGTHDDLKPSAITLSNDGNYAYIASFEENAVSVFRRDSSNGTLSFIATYKNGEENIDGLMIDGLMGALALVAIDNHLYVAGQRDNAIAIFSQEPETGELHFIEAIRFEKESQSLNGINALALTPTGSHLFATSAKVNRLSTFSRDRESGKLNLIQTLTKNADIQGLKNVNGVVVSPDGQFVYTTASGDNAVAIFSQAQETGLLTFVGAHSNGVNGVEGLLGAAGIAISADGQFLYVASINDHALVTFRRNPNTGQISFIEAKKEGIDEIDGLEEARAVITFGGFIYVASTSDNAITVFSITTADLSIAISESSASIKMGETLIKTITVKNQGPHQATDVILEGVSTNINLLSLESSQGDCTTTSEKFNCTLGLLNSGASAEITLKFSPTDIGEISLSATVMAQQFDPSPNNRATETIQAFIESDLSVEQNASAKVATLDTPLTYEITVINHGTQLVKNITLRDVIPETARFESAKINGDDCPFDEDSHTVTCTIPTLAGNARHLVKIIVTPTTEGVILTNTVTISADVIDPNLANNQATYVAEVPFLNTIKVRHDNTGKNLHNPHVTINGAIIGGSVSGNIENQGLISDVHILPEAILNGGKLSKTILNEGIIENVLLDGDTIINGGIVRGTIKGFSNAPATLNAQIAAGTQLSNVIIGKNSQISAEAIIGEGVIFMTLDSISEGLDLTHLLPTITWLFAESVDLSKNVLRNGLTLLEEINAIPELKNNHLVFSQSPDMGNLRLPIGKELMVLRPVTVRQGSEEDALNPRMDIHPDGEVIFTTKTGLQIIAVPTVQNQTAMQVVLKEIGVTEFELTMEGNLKVKIGGKTITVRPDLYSYSTDLPLELGLVPSSMVGLGELVFRFKDAYGVNRQQKFYPVPANKAELRSKLQGYPGANAVTFFNNGKVSLKIGSRTYSAVFDYLPTSGTMNTVTQLLFIPDRNGDGSEDIRIFYANGDEQVLYLMPFPEIAVGIQEIIEKMPLADYAISQDIHGNYLLSQGVEQLLMTVSTITQIDDETPPGMEIQADGSVIFITASGLKVTMQPTMQDLPALKQALYAYDITGLTVEKNGNITIPYDETITATARPELTSTPAWFGMQLGLHVISTNLPGVLNFMFVYLDDMGQKRQQFLFPAAKYPHALYGFFKAMPGVTDVTFNNNGTVSVEKENKLDFKGIFSYAVETNPATTGHIQFINIPDLNGDKIDDFAVKYETGEKQVIYQIPTVSF
ncbi:MAG: beta-propeller fold lactonase family protein, partial [Thiomargarita sp.]|nr:beta-propeller fold lactonase family protein [Thiomargarita sp.]